MKKSMLAGSPLRPTPMRTLRLLLALFALTSPRLAQGVDLAERYPATIEFSETGLGWTIEPEDVYRLSSFEFESGSGLEIAGGEATLVLARLDSNCLWGAVYPDERVTLRSPLAGNGETTDELFIRFAPAEVGLLFPAATIRGQGDAARRARALRLFRHKIGWRWCTPSGNTTVVPKGVVVVDCDTSAAKRRLFAYDRNSGRTSYVAEFEAKTMPPLETIDAKLAELSFEYVWERFDAEYANFGRHPELDWKKYKQPFLERARRAGTKLDLAAILGDMLRVLEDLHVWVRLGDTLLPGYARPRPLNAHFPGTHEVLGDVRWAGDNLWVGRTADGIGYLNVHGLTDSKLPAQVDAALEELADTRALVIDVRFNGGGNETLAQQIAGRFADRETVYAKHQFRAGEQHGELTPFNERSFAPRGERYSAPLVVLQGPVTLSSGESFVRMLGATPNATTLGVPTGGSSGNPRQISLDCGITVNLPRWRDADVDGNPLEGVGVQPDESFPVEQSGFGPGQDPVLDHALQKLRSAEK